MAEPSVEEKLPLTSLSFSILLALADGDQHGYGIMKSIELESGPRFRPSAGSLYAALDRLLSDDLIAESTGSANPDDDARRRYYALTSYGRKVLRAEAERLARAVASASRKKLLKGLTPARKVPRTSEP